MRQPETSRYTPRPFKANFIAMSLDASHTLILAILVL